jgi:hypothetical protein
MCSANAHGCKGEMLTNPAARRLFFSGFVVQDGRGILEQ